MWFCQLWIRFRPHQERRELSSQRSRNFPQMDLDWIFTLTPRESELPSMRNLLIVCSKSTTLCVSLRSHCTFSALSCLKDWSNISGVMEVLRSWPTVKQSVAYWYKYLSNQPMEKGQSQLLPLTHYRWIMQAGLESGLQRLGYWTPDMVEFSVNFGEWPYMLHAIHHATSCCRNIPQHTLMHWNHHVHEKACHCQQLVLVQVLAVKARNGLWRGCPSFESQWILAKRHEFKAWVKPVLMQRMDSLRASWSGTYILWGGSLVSLGRHSRAKAVWRKQHLQESYYVTMWWEIWIDTTNAYDFG